MAVSPDTGAPSKPTFLEAAAVYLKPRVLIVLFLGFSSGLPLALSGSTLLFWAAEVGVNLKTIGLFALVGTPYTLKFLWAPGIVALGALMVAAASATQDIVVDAFRIESLDESEQAAGMASYVAAYRVGMLASSAGALYVVTGFEAYGLSKHGAWTAGYVAMAAFVIIGIVTTLVATEPEKSARIEAAHKSQN